MPSRRKQPTRSERRNRCGETEHGGFGWTPRQVPIEERIRTAKRAMERAGRRSQAIAEMAIGNRRPSLREQHDSNGIQGFGREPKQRSIEERIQTAKRALEKSRRLTRAIRIAHSPPSSLKDGNDENGD